MIVDERREHGTKQDKNIVVLHNISISIPEKLLNILFKFLNNIWS